MNPLLNRLHFFLGLILFSTLQQVTPAYAHSPGRSLLILQTQENHLSGTLTIYYGDLPLIVDGLPFHVPHQSDPDWPNHEKLLIGYLNAHLRFFAGDSSLAEYTQFGPVQEINEQNNVVIPLRINHPPAQLRSLIIEQNDFYQSNPFFTTLVTFNTGTQQKSTVLSRTDPRTELFLQPRAELAAFLRHGWSHILSGIDHIFFILLLIFSPFLAGKAGPTLDWRKPGWALVKLATAFTVAHSITLAMAVLKIFFLPSVIVEGVIMFSIVFMGLHNLLHFNIQREWLIVFAFGLFHGYGFSSALQNLGLARGHLVFPLASFNLGVELGQLLVIALVFPLLYVLTLRWENSIRLIRYATVGITVTAGWWLFALMV